MSSPRPQPLPLIIAAWLVAGLLLAGGVVLAMTLGARGEQTLALAVFFGAFIGYGLVQRVALTSAHDYADARRARHRCAGQLTSALPPLIVSASTAPIPHVPAHQSTGPAAVERDITALAVAVGAYRPRRGCDADTAVIPAIRAAATT